MPNQKRDAKAEGKQLQAELATMRRMQAEQHERMLEVMEDMRRELGIPPRVENAANTDLTGDDISRFEYNEGRNTRLYLRLMAEKQAAAEEAEALNLKLAAAKAKNTFLEEKLRGFEKLQESVSDEIKQSIERQAQEPWRCDYCGVRFINAAIVPCGHGACEPCLKQWQAEK